MTTILATRSVRRALLAGGAALVGLAALGIGLYGTGRLSGNGACTATPATLARIAGAARGELAAFQAGARPERLPPLAFRAPDGSPTTLADLAAGRTVLLNLWATWCEPCRREMPALDALQEAEGGPRFTVAAVNIDTRNLDRPAAWLKAAGITRLDHFSDPEARIFQDLRRVGLADGMPTTILVDPAGCRLGVLAGPAEWASPDGIALVRAALAGSDGVRTR